MIIVEGPDGSGKTTLAREISEHLGFPIATRVVDKDTNAMTNLKVWTEENVQRGFHHVIYDRHRLISELIYGSVMRSRPSAPFDNVHWLSVTLQTFYKAKPFIVYCMPSLERVQNNVLSDLDNVTVAPYITEIYYAYVIRAALDYARDPDRVVIWNYELENVEGATGILDSLRMLIKRMERL